MPRPWPWATFTYFRWSIYKETTVLIDRLEFSFLIIRPDTHWSHEDMSKKMLDRLINENQIEFLTPDDIKMIKDIIDSSKATQEQSNPNRSDIF